MSSPFPVPSTPERIERLRQGARRIVETVRARLSEPDATAVDAALQQSNLTDDFLRQTLAETLALVPEGTAAKIEASFALVAVGGSGRRDPAPYSDVDLLFLVDAALPRIGREWIEQLIRDLWDAGLSLGHSVRTPKECLAAALEDVQFATSLIEARRLWGSSALFDEMHRKFRRRVVRSRHKVFCERAIAERVAERDKHGGAVLSLVPDVKKSRGGLRDLHLLRWLAFAEFDSLDLSVLVERGLFTDEDLVNLRHAREYLSKIRARLHLQAGKAQDVLTRDEQLRLAEEYGFQPTIGQRPVERFMQSYFRYSSLISRLAQRMIARYQSRSLTDRIVGYVASHRAEHRFLVRWDGIDVLPRYKAELLRDAEQIMRLFTLAALYGLPPKAELVEEIRRELPASRFDLTPEIAQRFRRILKTSALLGPILRTLDEAGMLERLIPDFAHAHCLLQFNQYHSYTVDEHTFRAVEILTSFARDEGPLGRAYRSIAHPEVVHLAMLLHDLGKGFPEDHCEVGKRIAARIGPRLGFSDEQTDQLVRLIEFHLVMPNTAFWRDISDPRVLLDFSRIVGSAEVLKMQFVMTAADVAAVGPGVWTDWKAGLLAELYRRTLRILSGDGDPLHEREIRGDCKARVLAILLRDSSLDPMAEEAWLDREFDTLPLSYLVETDAARIASDLESISRLNPRDIAVDAAAIPEKQLVEYRVLIAPEYSAGCFHRICGVLTALRMEIHTAQICTTTQGVVVDRFLVSDPDFSGEIPPERIDDVRRTLLRVITGELPVRELFMRKSRFARTRNPTPYAEQPTRLNLDNDSSERCTLIEVFAHDRQGLLFELSNAIYEAGLSVELAKIGTHMEQVVDVFYVKQAEGGKLEDAERLERLRGKLEQILEDPPAA